MTPADVTALVDLTAEIQAFLANGRSGEAFLREQTIALLEGAVLRLGEISARYAPPASGLRGALVDLDAQPTHLWFTTEPQAHDPETAMTVRYDNGNTGYLTHDDIRTAAQTAGSLLDPKRLDAVPDDSFTGTLRVKVLSNEGDIPDVWIVESDDHVWYTVMDNTGMGIGGECLVTGSEGYWAWVTPEGPTRVGSTVTFRRTDGDS